MLKNYTAEAAVTEWEAMFNNGENIKPRKVRSTVKNIAEINIKEQRGVTVNDIHFKNDKDSKRGIIFRLLNRQLLVPLPHRDGRLKQYVLSNLYNEFDTLRQPYTAITNGNYQDADFDYGIIDRIAEYFSREKPGLHNIHIQTSTDKENYRWLVKEWKLNLKNKSKSKEFRLDKKRKYSLTIYPNGTLLITISCSSNPFKLSNTTALIEFFSILGEIRKGMTFEIGSSSEIPPVNEWELTQYDIDNTISIEALKKNFSSQINVSSSLRNSIPIRLFGHLFYCYIKPMPSIGESVRFEERVYPDKKPLNEGIKDILETTPPFKKATDLKNNSVVDDN